MVALLLGVLRDAEFIQSTAPQCDPQAMVLILVVQDGDTHVPEAE